MFIFFQGRLGTQIRKLELAMKWSSNQNLKLKEAFLADDHPPKKAQICFPTDNPKKHESFFWTFPKDNPDIRMGSASCKTEEKKYFANIEKSTNQFFEPFPKDNPDIRVGSASSPPHCGEPALHHQKYSWQVEGEEGEGEDQHCYQQLKKCYF